MAGTLIIVPCGQRKIWDRDPLRGPVAARDAYTGAPFKVNRAYAERFGDRWLILSAKYGFIGPDFVIPGPYDVTFKRRSSNPISLPELGAQAERLELSDYARVVVLGGKEYRDIVAALLGKTNMEVEFPTAGLPIGKAMQLLKRAVHERVHPVGL